MIKITGLREMQDKIKQMKKFAAEIDGEITNVEFDPSDPSSIEAAIQSAHDAVDAKAQSFANNDWVMGLAEDIKDNAREGILEKAAASRIKD